MALADLTGIAAPTVAKLMKMLSKADLVTSTRGATGGYTLNGEAETISVADVVVAIEGPIALTACVDESDDLCLVESTCSIAGNWESVNSAVRTALEQVTLTHMAPDWRAMFPDLKKELS